MYRKVNPLLILVVGKDVEQNYAQNMAQTLDIRLPPNELGVFTVDYLNTICAKCPAKKACGPDGLNLFVIARAPLRTKQDITAAINLVIQTGTLPPRWKHASISFIHKGGNPLHLTSYRPIALVTCVTKILGSFIRDNLERVAVANNLATDMQLGFKRNTSLALHIKERFTNDKECCVLQIDIRKAFDSVDWNTLVRFLTLIGLDSTYVNGIRALYQEAEWLPKVNGLNCRTL